MKRVLLISINEYTAPYPVYPLGLSYVAHALQQRGYQVMLHDVQVDGAVQKDVISTFAPDAIGISLRNVDDVDIESQSTLFDSLPKLSSDLRAWMPKVPIVLGGSAFSLFPEEFLSLSKADYGLIGAGEDSFPILLEALEKGADLTEVPGLVSREEDGKIVVGVCGGSFPSSFSTGLGDFPRLVDFYDQNSSILNMQTQRGCRYHCCFCTYPSLEGRTTRPRPVGEVADEMLQLQAQGARYVFIVDAVFNSSTEHVTTVCEELLRRDVQIPWGCFMRPAGLSREVLDLARRANLTHIEFGSDSFSDDVLRMANKRLSFDEIATTSELTSAAGIDFCHFLLFGGPGESDATVSETLLRAETLPRTVFMASIGMRIYRDTPLWHRAVKEGQIDRNDELLKPVFYLSKDVTIESLRERLQNHCEGRTNWLYGDIPEDFKPAMAQLRKRGVVGPLWSYLMR
jgi:radical SAM superfamily enzyme YgiQ (UPF0313 family)